MSAADVLLKPEECALLLVDFQAGLGFGVESMPRQTVVNNAIALARTAVAFKVPVIASTSASPNSRSLPASRRSPREK
jgi:nicotinamidase-related amidase